MVSLIQSVRALLGLILLVFSFYLTFNGFPGALLSWLGGGVVITGYTGSISTITHEDTGMGHQGPWSRIAIISVGFAIASLGSAMIEWGGLVSVSVGQSITIPFRETGIILGIVGGLFNVDKTLYVSGTSLNSTGTK